MVDILELNCLLSIFNGNGWMRQSGCLGDAPLLPPSNSRDRQITSGSRVYGKKPRLVKLKLVKPKNEKKLSSLFE